MLRSLLYGHIGSSRCLLDLHFHRRGKMYHPMAVEILNAVRKLGDLITKAREVKSLRKPAGYQEPK